VLTWDREEQGGQQKFNRDRNPKASVAAKQRHQLYGLKDQWKKTNVEHKTRDEGQRGKKNYTKKKSTKNGTQQSRKNAKRRVRDQTWGKKAVYLDAQIAKLAKKLLERNGDCMGDPKKSRSSRWTGRNVSTGKKQATAGGETKGHKTQERHPAHVSKTTESQVNSQGEKNTAAKKAEKLKKASQRGKTVTNSGET